MYMLLNLLNRYYLCIGLILFATFSASLISHEGFVAMQVVSFLSFLFYGITIYHSSLQTKAFYRRRNLAILVFGGAVLEVILFQLLSFYIDGDTFVFSKADAMLYYTVGLKMSQMHFEDGFYYMTEILGWGTDDWGAFMWVSTIFRIFPSQQFLSFCNCIVGTISALMVFDIGRHFMPRKYAFLAALSFSLASFTLVHHALLLKETIMVCFILASFNCFVTYIRKKECLYLCLSLFCLLFVAFFRIPTALLLLSSLGLTWVILYFRGPVAIALIVVFILLICSTSLFTYSYDRYLRGGDTKLIIERKNELADGGGIINQLADPIAAFIGPFPSISIKTIKSTPLYASGLLYRVLLSAPFFMGVYYIIKKRNKKMYPVFFFFLINALGVALSVKGLETRLSIPHFPMLYIVAFWFLAQYDCNELPRKMSKKMIYAYFIGVMGICFLWNLR